MSATPLVWIVDDDIDDQYLLDAAFKQIYPPISTKQLSDGEELLPCLKKALALPRLILLDLNMVCQNGFDALEELRTIPAYKDLPVVVLTTSDCDEDKRKSMRLGANGFLTKPSSQKATISMLNKLASDWQLNQS